MNISSSSENLQMERKNQRIAHTNSSKNEDEGVNPSLIQSFLDLF